MEMHEGTCEVCGEETLVSVEFDICEPCTIQDAEEAFPYDMG